MIKIPRDNWAQHRVLAVLFSLPDSQQSCELYGRIATLENKAKADSDRKRLSGTLKISEVFHQESLHFFIHVHHKNFARNFAFEFLIYYLYIKVVLVK